MHEERAQETRSVCPYCGVGCGIVLRTRRGKVVGLRGEPEHPVSRGALCPKGATAHEFVHHPDRLISPLVRRDGRLVEASWDEAYDTVAEGFLRIARDHGPDALAVISSARATVEENYLAQKFARVTLGTNNLDQCFRVCHSATVTGLGFSLGTGAMTNPISDLADPAPAAILIVGSNTPHSHPIVWSEWVKPALAAGSRLVVVDPRTTAAAEAAEVHLAIRPGTEIPLFHAIAHEIFERGWQDDVFLRERCEGADRFRAFVRGYPPERAAEVCGVAASSIARAAEAYASEKPASILYGLGVTEHRTGTDNVRALANLALATGNLGNRGGGVNALRGQNDVQGATDMCRPESLPGYQAFSDPGALGKFERAWKARIPLPRPDDVVFCSRMWELALAGAIRGLYVIGSDPALTEGNADKVRRALSSLELLVVQEVFPSETTKLAHVVLPSASYAEKEGTFVNTDRRVQRVRKAIEPVGRSRPDWRILLDLADRMGRPLGVRSPEETFEEIRKLVPAYAGLTYRRLETPGGIPWPCPDESHPGTMRLHERSFPIGRARLALVEPMPPAEEPDRDFPFLLTTGRTFLQYNSGTMTRRTRMEKGDRRSHVEISAADASALGVQSGDPVRVATRRGEVVVEAKIVEIARGVLWMPFHFAEAPGNRLTNDAVDPQCGITELKACAARVEPQSAR